MVLLRVALPLRAVGAPAFVAILTLFAAAACDLTGNGDSSPISVADPPADRDYVSSIDDPAAAFAVPPLAQPAPRTRYIDPVFGTPIWRVSGVSSAGGWESQIYSQLQAISPDNQYLLTNGSAGYSILHLPSLRRISVPLSEAGIPRWRPDQPHEILYYHHQDERVRLMSIDVESGKSRALSVLPGYASVAHDQSFDEVSRDGRWIVGLGHRAADDADVIFAYNMHSLSMGAQLVLSEVYASRCEPNPAGGELWPDWVAPSPLGDFLLVQWARAGTEPCSGLETFDVETGAFLGRVMPHHRHADVVVVPDWRDQPPERRQAVVSVELNIDPSAQQSIGYRYLPGEATESDPHHLVAIEWGNGGHISCRGPAGTCLVSCQSDESPTPGLQPFEDELFVVELTGKVRRLAHHRSTAGNYWAQPRATWSADGRYAVFASDWGSRDGPVEPYVLEVLGETDSKPRIGDGTPPTRVQSNLDNAHQGTKRVPNDRLPGVTDDTDVSGVGLRVDVDVAVAEVDKPREPRVARIIDGMGRRPVATEPRCTATGRKRHINTDGAGR